MSFRTCSQCRWSRGLTCRLLPLLRGGDERLDLASPHISRFFHSCNKCGCVCWCSHPDHHCTHMVRQNTSTAQQSTRIHHNAVFPTCFPHWRWETSRVPTRGGGVFSHGASWKRNENMDYVWTKSFISLLEVEVEFLISANITNTQPTVFNSGIERSLTIQCYQLKEPSINDNDRGRGKQYIFRVNLQIQGAPFFPGVILCIGTESEEIFQKSPFLAVCTHFW